MKEMINNVCEWFYDEAYCWDMMEWFLHSLILMAGLAIYILLLPLSVILTVLIVVVYNKGKEISEGEGR